MKKNRNNGITLVALVITIIILLILAGISIQAISNTGLFANAKRAKDESMKGQLQEEISLAIQSIQTEEIYKGNSVTLETLAGGQLEEALTDITAELNGDEINGEYKNYAYTIDSNLKVTINGEVSGAKISGTAEVQTSGYVFEGTTVDVKVTASVTEGTITGIVAPEGATLKTDTSTTEKVYTVSKSGTYIFKVTTDNGKTKSVKATVNNILSAPQITVSEITENSFKINVENDYPEGAITEYRYSVGGTVKKQGTTDKNYTVTGLEELTEYNNIQVTAYINSVNKVSNVEKVTTDLKDRIAYSWDEIAEMAKAISNDTSITDDSDTATLNGTTYNSLSIKNNIKKVKKEYIPEYNKVPAQMPTTDDYLWLLSCGEIWDNGYNGGTTRGLAVDTEGKQYKYYKINLGSTNYLDSNDITKKPSIESSNAWWLRSTSHNGSGFFSGLYTRRRMFF